MRVLVVGKSGQLGWELQRSAPGGVEIATVGAAEMDVGDPEQVRKTFADTLPRVVINTSAYTAVDKAESDRTSAERVNVHGVQNLADQCLEHNAKLIHVSTDFVFNGLSSVPYQPSDHTDPLGVYGETKLLGERVIQESLGDSAIIVRTAWLYSSHGNNFVKTMLRLMGEKPQLGVVYDQIGTPTWAFGLANALWLFAQENDAAGVFHWTDAGVASWYDFAVAIQELALEKGLLKASIPIKPIPASAYPTPAKRPNYSVLDKSKAESILRLDTVHWRLQLSKMMDELAK